MLRSSSSRSATLMCPAGHSPPSELGNHSLRQREGRAQGASAACAHLPRPPWLQAPPGAAVVPLGPCPPSPPSRWVSPSGVCSSGSRLGAWFPTLPARQPSASSPAPSLSWVRSCPWFPFPPQGQWRLRPSEAPSLSRCTSNSCSPAAPAASWALGSGGARATQRLGRKVRGVRSLPDPARCSGSARGAGHGIEAPSFVDRGCGSFPIVCWRAIAVRQPAVGP